MTTRCAAQSSAKLPRCGMIHATRGNSMASNSTGATSLAGSNNTGSRNRSAADADLASDRGVVTVHLQSPEVETIDGLGDKVGDAAGVPLGVDAGEPEQPAPTARRRSPPCGGWPARSQSRTEKTRSSDRCPRGRLSGGTA